MSKSRIASHAGSWYSDRGRELHQQLSSWLDNVDVSVGHARAIIAPHAGYYYCGSCGAYAYRQVDPQKVKRVFILGPSHHVRLSGCALSPANTYQTPLYELPIDEKIYKDLYATNEFQTMPTSTDEDEHSIEMHLPYIAKVMESRKGQFTIVPILVGSLSTDKEQLYGKLLSSYLADPDNLFVVSSDFCHWGSRFRYTYFDKSHGEVHKSIEHLDKMGMNLIESMDPVAFSDYLKKYQNTICGRHPIAVLLNAISTLRSTNGHHFSLKFLNYKQSSQCKSTKDSSVSYAAGVLVMQ